MGSGDTLLNAALGAAVTVVFSFTGVSPLLGGGVSGYLQRETRASGATAGALSGGLASIPLLLLAGAFFVLSGVFGALLTGAAPVGHPVPGGAGLLVVGLLFVPLALAWNVGLGALGGYLGAYLREETGDGSDDDGPVSG